MRFTVYLPNAMHVAAITQPWEHDLTGTDIGHAARERLHIRRTEPQFARAVHHPHVGISGRELAHDVDVERYVEPPRHFVSDRHAPARECEHDDSRRVRIVAERARELSSRIRTVGEKLRGYSGTPPSCSIT